MRKTNGLGLLTGGSGEPFEPERAAMRRVDSQLVTTATFEHLLTESLTISFAYLRCPSAFARDLLYIRAIRKAGSHIQGARQPRCGVLGGGGSYASQLPEHDSEELLRGPRPPCVRVDLNLPSRPRRIRPRTPVRQAFSQFRQP
jgi:hypothetical protein